MSFLDQVTPEPEADGHSQLDAVLAHAPVMVFELDPAGRYTSSGGRALGEAGLDPGAIRGRSVFEVCADHPDILAAARRALAGEIVRQLTRLAGRSFEVIYSPGIDAEGKVRRVIGVGYDVTESLSLAAARAEEQARLKDFAEATSDWFWETDETHRFVWLSDRFQAATGLVPAAVLGTVRATRRLPDPGDDDWDLHLADLAARRPFRDFTFAFRDARGGRRIAQVSGVPFFDAEGGFRGYRGSGRDVTRQRDAQRRLRESEQRFRSLVENLRGIYFCRGIVGAGADDDAGVMIYGEGAPVVDGIAEGGCGGRLGFWRRSIVPEDRERYAALEARRNRDRVPYELDFRVMHPATGELRWMREVAWVTEDAEAARTYLDSYVLDITDQRRREEALTEARSRLEAQNRELHEARRAAEEASRAKSDFLAVMSHEIRTPMTGVLGMADLLMAADLPERERRYAAAIRTSGRHLLSVVNDILDFSRIEAGRLELERIDFSILELLEQVRSLVSPQAAERGLELHLGLDEPSPPTVRGDPTRLQQVLLNLVGNGLKFTQRGGVTVRVAHGPEGDGRVRLRFSVRDTGVGIAPERQDMLFRAFTQAESSTSRTYGGSGLGLAISKRLVEAMGGEIGVESASGCGSLFWFEVRLEVGDAVLAAERAAFDPASVPPLRVLLAEDVELNRELVREMLGRYGHEVILAEDGQAAVRLAAEGGYDLVLMDVQMPVVDGVEATRRIRRLPPPAGQVPIVALTANVVASERERYLAVGMDSCVTKPIAWPALLAALAEIAAGPAPSATAASNEGARAVPSADAEGRTGSLPGAGADRVPLLDRGVIERLGAGLPAGALADLLRRVIEDAERSWARLRALPAGGEELTAEMHRLGGTAGSFGLTRISTLAAEIEAAARDGLDTPEMGDRLATAVAATRAELRGFG
jgi:PAS domain S-box-containing protein